MRVLKFIVTEQHIKKDPDCDFTGIIINSVGYLKAQFIFDSSWDNLNKIVEFSNSNEQVDAKLIDKTNSCYISPELLKDNKINVRVIGVNSAMRIETNITTFRQERN